MKRVWRKLSTFMLVAALILGMTAPSYAEAVAEGTPEEAAIIETDGEEVIEEDQEEIIEEVAADEEIQVVEDDEDIVSPEEEEVAADEEAAEIEEVFADEEAYAVNDAAEIDPADYVFGTVNMDYADFYYGELEGIDPTDAAADTAATTDPVTAAGYREEGYYDAATFATPKGFIYEKKWETWPGTYSEPITNDEGIVEGGRILGVADVAVAVKKTVYDAAIKAPKSVVGQKAAQIKLNEDQSVVPLSYKILNGDGIYTRYQNLTEAEEVELDGACFTDYMGDDIWWEGRAMKHTDDQIILGGVIEWKHDPADPEEQPVVLGLKHNENMYSDEWIGWGMGPGNVGIYGGNETGWQRFSGISGNYLTKMSYILMEKDGSVHYYNATSEAGILNPLVPSGIVEDGKHPYNIQMTSYEFTKERVIIDFTLDVPTRADGTPEVTYTLWALDTPGGGRVKRDALMSDSEKAPVYEESDWVGGHQTIHIELNRQYFGTGRYKYWFDPSSPEQEGDRTFSGTAQWKMLYPDLTSKNVYIKDNKLVVDSDIFTLEDYINNPYQQIEIIGNKGTDEIWTTGDANTNKTLFAGGTMKDGTVVEGLFKEDGSFNMDGKFFYSKGWGPNAQEVVETIFPNGADESYEIVLYCGGFPIIKGEIDNRKDQKIEVAASVKKTFGDKAFALGAKAETGLTYKSSKPSVAAVDASGKVTVKGAGSAVITVTAAKTDDYKAAQATVKITVDKAASAIKVKTTSKSFKLAKVKKKAQSFSIGASVNSKGKLTYKKVSGKKQVTINKSGKVSVKKKTKKGTYKIKVKVSSAATANYKAAAKTVTITVKVK